VNIAETSHKFSGLIFKTLFQYCDSDENLVAALKTRVEAANP